MLSYLSPLTVIPGELISAVQTGIYHQVACDLLDKTQLLDQQCAQVITRMFHPEERSIDYIMDPNAFKHEVLLPIFEGIHYHKGVIERELPLLQHVFDLSDWLAQSAAHLFPIVEHPILFLASTSAGRVILHENETSHPEFVGYEPFITAYLGLSLFIYLYEDIDLSLEQNSSNLIRQGFGASTYLHLALCPEIAPDVAQLQIFPDAPHFVSDKLLDIQNKNNAGLTLRVNNI